MPKLEGVLETALYVADLERSAAFFARIFGFRPLLREERMRALSVAERQVLLLFKHGGSVRPTHTPNGTIPPHDARGTQHMAFAILATEVEAWRSWLHENGVTIESEVHTDRGHSIYFRDPDNHSIEVATRDLWPFEEQ